MIVLPTRVPRALEKPPRGAFAIAVHALNLLAMRQLRNDVERDSERCELVVIPSLCPLAVHAYDFSHTGELIDRAEAATGLWRRGGLDNRDALTALLPHRHRAAWTAHGWRPLFIACRQWRRQFQNGPRLARHAEHREREPGLSLPIRELGLERLDAERSRTYFARAKVSISIS